MLNVNGATPVPELAVTVILRVVPAGALAGVTTAVIAKLSTVVAGLELDTPLVPLPLVAVAVKL